MMSQSRLKVLFLLAVTAVVGLAVGTRTAYAEPIMQMQQQSQTVDFENFNFNFAGLNTNNVGGGVLTVLARGDYTLGFPNIEFFDVDVDSGLFVLNGIAPDNSTLITSFDFDDTEFERQIPINAATLASIIADGTANVSVNLSNDVHLFDPDTAFVKVTLEYEAQQQIVPEPASIATWSLLGLMGVGYGWRRKRRRAKS